MKTCLKLLALASAAFSAPALAQSAPPQSPMGEGPQKRPEGSGEMDAISRTDRIGEAVDAARAKGGQHKEALNGKAAAAADIIAGSNVNDSRGKWLGTVDRVEADGVVVASEGGKVKVPLDAFGKNKNGLLLGVTKADFDKLVAEAAAAPTS